MGDRWVQRVVFVIKVGVVYKNGARARRDGVWSGALTQYGSAL
jgi:hypothetical protein